MWDLNLDIYIENIKSVNWTTKFSKINNFFLISQ